MKRAESAEAFLSESKEIAKALNDSYTELFISLLKGEDFTSYEVRENVRKLRTNITLLMKATNYGVTTS